MNSSPAATAARPAARVSVVVVMDMSGSLVRVRGGAPRHDLNVGTGLVVRHHHLR